MEKECEIMCRYENMISLGHFCSIAKDLESMGVRSHSGPFDWLISSWEGIESLIDNGFKDFLNEDYLYQSKSNSNHYKNIKYDIWFYHDFEKYDSLEAQLNSVQVKYKKRIENFYRDIAKPTLFIRYIKEKSELEYIELNYKKIQLMFKQFNQSNELLFIANSGLQSENVRILNVKQDESDTVCRTPLYEGNLVQMLSSSTIYDNKKRIENKQFYLQKLKSENDVRYKVKKYFTKVVNKLGSITNFVG